MWKDIKGWESYYEVNEYGEVRNKLNQKLIIGDCNNIGYQRVTLFNKKNHIKKQRFFRHRLVAIHFIENPNNLPEVNHIDGNKKNNHISNLEWTSRKGNEEHAWANGLKGKKRTNKIVVIEYENGTTVEYDSQREIRRQTGIPLSQLQVWLVRGVKSYHKFGISNIYFK